MGGFESPKTATTAFLALYMVVDHTNIEPVGGYLEDHFSLQWTLCQVPWQSGSEGAGMTQVARGQKLPPMNIPIPTKIGSKMGGAPTPKWDPIGFDPQPSRASHPPHRTFAIRPPTRSEASAAGPAEGLRLGGLARAHQAGCIEPRGL